MIDASVSAGEDPHELTDIDIAAAEVALYWRCMREMTGPEDEAEFIDTMHQLIIHSESPALRRMASKAIETRSKTSELSA